MKNRVLICVVFACVVTATSASAQTAQRIANLAKRAGIGASVGKMFTFDDEVNVGTGVGVSFGLSPREKSGLGPTIGFGWYEGDLTFSGLTGDAEVGSLRVRPLMAGVGYTWVKDRLAAGVSFNAGISFNSIRLSDQYRTFFGPGTEVRVDASNSFAMRPQVRVEYAVAKKVGVFSTAGYFFTEFNNVVETPVGRFENEWDASSFNLFAGVMFYPFR
jgi:hypothetical protein